MIADLIHKVAALDQSRAKYRRRPSSAGPERCIRSMVYHGLGYPAEPLSGRAKVVFDDSSWHEELTKDWLRKSSYIIKDEQLRLQTPVGPGSIDWVTEDPQGKQYLTEHKALNHFTWQRYESGEHYPRDYFSQCANYMNGYCFKFNMTEMDGLLLIKNKNTSQYLEYLLIYKPNIDTLIVKQLVSSIGTVHDIGMSYNGITYQDKVKFDAIDQFIKDKKLPRRPYIFGEDWNCDYCQYSKECWKGFEAEFVKFKKGLNLGDDVADMIKDIKDRENKIKDHQQMIEGHRSMIKNTLVSRGIEKGAAGQYLCSLLKTKRSKLDKNKLPQQVREIMERCTTITPVVQLKIQKMKQGGEK